MLVLDSNTISYYFRGDPQVVPRLQAIRPGDLGVPAIVEYELRYGLMRLPQEQAAPRLAALAQLLRPMQQLPFDAPCAEHAARIRATLEAERATFEETADTFRIAPCALLSGRFILTLEIFIASPWQENVSY